MNMEKRKEQPLPPTQTIIATLNEAEGIGPTIKELLEIVPNTQIIVVDGKSTDRTVEIAKDLGAKIVFQEDQGKGDALATALKQIDPTIDYIIVTDADFTYPVEKVPEMIRILQEKPNIGMVCGNRFNNYLDPKAFRNVFNIGNHLIAFAHNTLNGIPLNDPLTGLRVIRAEILRNWKVKSKGFDIEVELNHRVERQGFEIAEIDIGYRKRLGEKKLKVRHGIQILKRILLETA
jgi:dolichol-phosphate hexosyltransferase